MSVNLIVAVDLNNGIGMLNGELPWHSPEDLKFFKEKTEHGTVLMGIKTFLSLRRPNGLPNRKNIVLTTMLGSFVSNECVQVHNNIDIIRTWNTNNPDGDLWVIGGASIYELVLREKLVQNIFCSKMHLSSCAEVRIHEDFPLFNTELFKQKQKENDVHWEIQSTEFMVPEHGPCITFTHLKNETH